MGAGLSHAGSSDITGSICLFYFTPPPLLPYRRQESVVQFLVVHPDGLVVGAAEVGAQGPENNSAPESLPLAAGQAGDDQAGPAGPAPRLPRGSGAAAAARDAIGAMEAELAACEAEIADRDALVVTLLDALAKVGFSFPLSFFRVSRRSGCAPDMIYPSHLLTHRF